MAIEFNISATSTKPLILEYPFLFRYAASSAINDTAFDARKRLGQHAKRVFKNPRPLTLNPGEVVSKSTAKTLRAMVGLRDQVSKGTAPDTYLAPQVHGGGRVQKRFERALINKFPQFGRSTYFVPALQNKEFLDAYGQLKGSKVVQMLSHLQAFGEQGYKANIKNPKRSLFFPVFTLGDYGMLPPGVYKRDAIGSENFEAVLFAVRKQPQYRKRFRYFETVAKSVRMVFPVSFSKRFQSMSLKQVRKFNQANNQPLANRVRPLP